MKPKKLIIFDWDGTIMDSLSHIVACLQHILTNMGKPVPEAETIVPLVGHGAEQVIQAVCPELTEQQVKETVKIYRDYFIETQQQHSIFYDGVLPMLKALRAEKLLAVATARSRMSLDLFLQQPDLIGVFHATKTAEETANKPNPLMLLQILETLSVAAEDALMIGDTTYDIEMAKAAKIDSIAVCYGAHQKDVLLEAKPTIIVDDVDTLASYVMA